MLTIEQLIQESRDPRLQKLPVYVRNLIWDLAKRMESEHLRAESARSRAEEEVEAARKIAAEGPENSDTFMDLPRAYSTYSYEEEQKPLGKGVNIEFRGPEVESGEGINAKWENDGLLISGLNHLSVIPIDRTSVKIVETRELP